MLGKDIIRIVLYGVGLGSLSALVYLAGPLIAIGDYRPLENYIVRDIVIVLLVAGVGRRRRLALLSAPEELPSRSPRASAARQEGRQRRGRPQGQDEGRARDAEARERRQGATTSTTCPGTSSSARRAPARPRRWSIPA